MRLPKLPKLPDRFKKAYDIFLIVVCVLCCLDSAYLVYTGHPGYVFTALIGSFALGTHIMEMFARKLQKLTEEITNVQAFYIEEWKKLNQDTHSYYQNMLAQYENSDGQVKH